jgi:ABC-type Fe3+-hydroxamate transport system substrate-binding protein
MNDKVSPTHTDALSDAAGVKHAPVTGTARIVSLVPSLTELLCDLGLAPQLVGRTGFCVHPREVVRTLPKVGGTKSVNLPRLRALAPTHVVVNVDENEKSAVEEIASFAPHIIVTHPLHPRDNIALYALLGSIFRREAEAAALTRRFEEAWGAMRRQAAAFPRENVLYLIWKKPWMTVSRDTYISATLKALGWNTAPAAASVRYPEIDLAAPELLKNLRRILLSSEPYRFRERDVAQVQALTGGAIPVSLIDGEMTSWYGSRAITGIAWLTVFRQRLLAGANT